MVRHGSATRRESNALIMRRLKGTRGSARHRKDKLRDSTQRLMIVRVRDTQEQLMETSLDLQIAW